MNRLRPPHEQKPLLFAIGARWARQLLRGLADGGGDKRRPLPQEVAGGWLPPKPGFESPGPGWGLLGLPRVSWLMGRTLGSPCSGEVGPKH